MKFNLKQIYMMKFHKQLLLHIHGQHYDLELFELYITKSWATYSNKEQFIAYHRHMTSHFSFVYYVEANEQGNLFL